MEGREGRDALILPKWGERKGEERSGTHEADILEQTREDPNPWLRDDESNDVEDEAEDGHGEEGTEQTHDAHREVPDPEPERIRPEGEHDGREHHRDLSQGRMSERSEG